MIEMTSSEHTREEAKFWDELYSSYLDYNLFDVRQRKRIPVPAWWASPKVGYLLYRKEILTYLFRNLARTDYKALEVGCGSGWLSLELARKGLNIVATDIASRTLTLAKRYSRRQNTAVEYVACDMNHLPFDGETFDLIVVCDALHHIPNIHIVLQNIRDLLKDDGRLFAFDYTGQSDAYLKAIYPPRALSGFIRRVKHKKYSYPRHLQGGSPHEGKGARSWLAGVKMLFDLEKEMHLMFQAHNIMTPIVPYLKEESSWLTFLTLLLKSFDRIVLKFRPNISEYVWIVAKPHRTD